MHGKNVTYLRMWVQKVIPLVYDDSLSYYELLDKVVYKLNEVIGSNNELVDFVAELSTELSELKVTVNKLVGGEIADIISDAISEAIKHVYFGLTDSGYFVAYIPTNWREVVFNTTGYDINVPNTQEYGHLVLSY